MSTHGPIQSEVRDIMVAIASALDQSFNPDPSKNEIGFVLLTFRFGEVEGGRVNYISNGVRADVRVALKELLARWEGMDPSGEGTA